jgi:lysophospholipase L1-like esterase
MTTTSTIGSPLKVHLIGDSIRLNAQPFARRFLAPAHRIAAPLVNCESSHTVSANIRNWLAGADADVVHINCGLHDIRHNPGCERPVSSPDEYVNNLRAIFGYLATTGARIIWATSTPINEGAHNRTKISRRYESDLLRYNRLSADLARDAGFEVNDMFEKLSSTNFQALLLPDGVHFTPSGNELIGKFIAESVQSVRP